MVHHSCGGTEDDPPKAADFRIEREEIKDLMEREAGARGHRTEHDRRENANVVIEAIIAQTTAARSGIPPSTNACTYKLFACVRTPSSPTT
jgi:hypothetical protein